jgi:hypothetical protein
LPNQETRTGHILAEWDNKDDTAKNLRLVLLVGEVLAAFTAPKYAAQFEF